MLGLVLFRRALTGRGNPFANHARFVVAVSCCYLVGCAPALSILQVRAAASKLERAEALRAEELAPYEYWMAKTHLDEARSEAAEADYGDAIDLAHDSERYAEAALALIRGLKETKPPPLSAAGH